jgi:hypothetical protein
MKNQANNNDVNPLPEDVATAVVAKAKQRIENSLIDVLIATSKTNKNCRKIRDRIG